MDTTQSIIRRASIPARYLLGLPLAFILLILAAGTGFYLYAAAILNPVTSTPITAAPNRFDGSYLLSLSDADMVGTGYADGQLMQVPGMRDALTILPLPLDPGQPQLSQTFVSNSVTAYPQVMATSPDGERVYVIETAAEIADDVVAIDVFAEPPNGRSLTVYDLTSGKTEIYDVMESAIHLALHPEERYVAVGSAAAGDNLAILPVATLDDPTSYQYMNIDPLFSDVEARIHSVYWHPSGNFLAVGANDEEVVFFRVIEDENGAVSLHSHGEPLFLGNHLTYGEFTAEGDYYLTAEINWSAYPGSLGYAINPRGEMIAIRFDPTAAAAHTVTSRVAVGQSPEGFALSPDESLIVTVDMRRTYLPDNLAFIPGSDLNSLSLLTFDRESGELVVVEDYGFEGVLPEHAVFDSDGDSLAVVVYNERENPLGDGYIEFWNVTTAGDKPALERTGARIDVVRGAHVIGLLP